MNSNTSYFGLRGVTPLRGELKAIYQLEFGVRLDQDIFGSALGGGGNVNMGADLFYSRNSFLGLQAGWGALKAGRFDTPVHALSSGVDQFDGRIYTDIGSLVGAESRVNNIIQYSSPKFADVVTVNLATIAKESEVDIGGGAVAKSDRKLFKAFSSSVMIDLTDSLRFGLGYENNTMTAWPGIIIQAMGGIGVPLFSSATGLIEAETARLTAEFDLDVVKIGLLAQKVSYGDAGAGNQDEKSIALSGAFSLSDNLRLKTQIIQNDFDLAPDKIMQYTLGADYQLGLQSTVYFSGTHAAMDGDRVLSAIGAGFEHRF